MELHLINLPLKQTSEDIFDVITEVVEAEEIIQPQQRNHFIEANTSSVTLHHLKTACNIPVFSRDNESTIPHQSFIEAVKNSASQFFNGHVILEPDIRVSHEIKAEHQKL